MRKKHAIVLLGLCPIAALIAVAIVWHRLHPNPDGPFTLSLSIRPSRFSRTDLFKRSRVDATLFFTNNTDEPIQFVTNGDFFQYIDMLVQDQDGKDHTISRFGDAYFTRLTRDKVQTVKPRETVGGTFSLALLVWEQPLEGTYKVQADLRYEQMNVLSNQVEIRVTP
jgi:hypothetical protein